MNENDYVIVVSSLEYKEISIKFNIPHDRGAEVIQYLTQFTHEIKRGKEKTKEE